MAGKQQKEKPEEQQFCCSVCLDLPKEPVTINCGHNYCRSCIEGFWGQEEEKGEYSCPQCREIFSPRPVLRKNNMLAELVERLKTSAQQASPTASVACAPAATVACAGPADVPCAGPATVPCAGPADVPCDFCCGTKPNKATMSCLVCLASYCTAHLQPHYSVPVLKKHQLVLAKVPLQEKMCMKHNKLMEAYCLKDMQLLCSLCAGDEHKGHLTNSVSIQKAEMEKCLVSRQKEVQERVQRRERELMELNRAEENLMCCAHIALGDCEKIFTELMSSMKRTHREVKQLIQAQEDTVVAQAEALRLQLQEDIARLRRREAQLEQLSHVDDHVRFIQVFLSLSTSCDSSDFSPGAGPLRSFRDVTRCVSEMREKLKAVLRDAWPRISTTVSYVDFSLQQVPENREDLLHYCCPLTLDVTSSYPYLHLIRDNLGVRPSPSPYPAQPDRFTRFPQVLCREGLSERCYWEVEWHARTLSAAVAYKDISRTSEESQFGNNDKSWSLECTAKGCSFRHNNEETTVSGLGCNRIGVYLDYKTGTLCFYKVSDPMVLLHKVQTTFTQPLYPGLGLNYEWYDVGVFAQLVKLW